MNCERLQENLYEYLDGTLSPDEKAAAEKHMLACNTCRQALQNERLTAQTLSGQFKEAVAKIELDAGARPSMERAVRQTLDSQPKQRSTPFWMRLIWPAMAAGAALIVVVFLGNRFRAVSHSTIAQVPAGRVVPVQVSYSAPRYTFRRDGAQVVDALTDDRRTVDGALMAGR